VAFGCGVPALKTVDATIRVSDRTADQGGAQGRLLAALDEQMEGLIDEEKFQNLVDRPAPTGVCYRKLFPQQESILKTTFESREELFRATGHSCMFPFFSSFWPCRLDTSNGGLLPDVVVDGFFAVPRERFGCPDFGELDEAQRSEAPDRVVTISPFPHEKMRITCSTKEDSISPTLRDENDLGNLFRIATECSSASDFIALYERGLRDGEDWCREYA